MTGAVIYSIITLGLNVLIGRVGMVSLCQFVLAAVGAWVALRLSYGTSIPFPLLLLAAGIVTGLIGVFIGLPALRLSGLHLALITLMAAGAITIVLRTTLFPNGGGGFFGNSAAGGASSRMPRPSIAQSDTAYYRFCAVIAALMFLVAVWHVRRKPGRAWAAIRQSQATAVAAGVNTVLYKLWAFALASFMAGVAGALLAAAAGGVSVQQFPVQNSVLLLAVVLMGGVYSIWGAVVAALFLRAPARPARRLGRVDRAVDDPLRRRGAAGADDRARRHRRPAAQGSGQARSSHRRPVPADGARRRDRGRRSLGALRRRRPDRPDDGDVRRRHVRADRPQRRRQDDVLQRAQRVRPTVRRAASARSATTSWRCPTSSGRDGGCAGRSRPSRRSPTSRCTRTCCSSTSTAAVTGDAPRRRRQGDRLRRPRARSAHRLVGVARRRRSGASSRSPAPSSARRGSSCSTSRRPGSPRRRPTTSAALIRRIPEETGALVILVDHDMSLVSACCATTAVLDFGRLIASGATAEVLRDDNVVRAYLGTEEVA